MRVLIVGPNNEQMAVATRIAERRGATLRHAATPEIAVRELCAGRGADLLLADATLDIASLIRALGTERIVVPVVAYGGPGDGSAAVAAVKAGATEFLPLPPHPELIAAILAEVGDEPHELVFEDGAMRDVLALARQIAPSDASVLITGESGTGKEVVARYVHRQSRRAERPFVSVNCAAIPENLLESELFGHEKGAFTGATARRIGKFEEASGGTLLLDEISEMDPRRQAKLLRALQEREIDRVGGTRPVKVDLRLIATSNRNLGAEVAAGRFREDLLFRLNVVNLHLPPLRERPADIAPLGRYFAARYARANGLPPRPLSETALGRLRAHAWPGNVRELENCVHRAVLLAGSDEIGPDAITLQGAAVGGRTSGTHGAEGKSALVGRTVAEVERHLILDTLRHTLGNRTHAASILGISLRTLRNKLRQYGDAGVLIPPPGGGGTDSVRKAA
jgi:two-component system, response regulator FlrC